jgi:hypothetical protein
LADDGRVFGSAKQTIVDAADTDYVKWLESQTPSPWPRDIAGEQTNDELQAVLRPFNLFVGLEYYAADARQRRYADDILVNGLPFSTDPISLGGRNFHYTEHCAD